METIFIPENKKSEKIHTSESEKYQLKIEVYKTGPKTWDYSKGIIYRVADNSIVCELERNYGQFPFLFFRKKDTEFLICGKSYMSQTIVDLSNGKTYDNTNDKYKDSWCWTEMHQLDENTLVVCGCYWGGPHHYRFYDMSDPSKGWNEVEMIPYIKNHGFEFCESDFIIKNGSATLVEEIEYIKLPNGEEIDYALYDEELPEISGAKIEPYKKKDFEITFKRIDNQIIVESQWLSERKQKEVNETQKELDEFLKEKELSIQKDDFYLKLKMLFNDINYDIDERSNHIDGQIHYFFIRECKYSHRYYIIKFPFLKIEDQKRILTFEYTDWNNNKDDMFKKEKFSIEDITPEMLIKKLIFV
jgi:hypothetical protein